MIEMLRKSLENAGDDLARLGRIDGLEREAIEQHEQAIVGHREGKKNDRRRALASRRELHEDEEYNAHIDGVMQAVGDIAIAAREHLQGTQMPRNEKYRARSYVVSPQAITRAGERLGDDPDPEVMGVVTELVSGYNAIQAERPEILVYLGMNKLYGKPRVVSFSLTSAGGYGKEYDFGFNFRVQRLMAGLRIDHHLYGGEPDLFGPARRDFDALADSQKLQVIASFLASVASLPPNESK